MTVKQYRATITSPYPGVVHLTQAYIEGLGEGMMWANVRATFKGGQPLYCQPGKLSLGTDNYVDMIDHRIAALSKSLTDKELGESLIPLLLLSALEETFPCPSK